MAARRVLIRVDGSSAIGIGHLVRCVALGEELVRHGMQPWFASRPGEASPIEFLARGHRVIRVVGSARREMTMIKAASPTDPAIARRPFAAVLLDHYGLGASWLREARLLGRRRVVIDDLANRPLPCELLVNATLGARAESYDDLVPRKAMLLIGSRFCMLRSAFAAGHDRAGARRYGPVRSVLVSLGGGDHSETLRVVVDAVRSALPDAVIDLVLGTSGVADLAAERGIRVHRDLKAAAMVTLMLRADLAIGAGGTTSWERCALALPSVSIRLAPNQDGVVEALVAAGATVDAGPVEDLTVAGLATQIAAIAGDRDHRRTMSENAWQLVDGRGAIRVAHAIDGVRVRRARIGDADTLWEWANDPDTRATSFDSRPIPYTDHLGWLRAVLADPSRLLLLGWNGVGLLGQVRFDDRGTEAEVSISVAPKHRGTVGWLLLRAGIRRYRRAIPGRVIIARVMEENRTSRRLFEAAGFARISADAGVVRYRLGAEPLAETVGRRAVG